MENDPKSNGTLKTDQIRAKIEALKREVRAIEARETREAKSKADRAHHRRVYMVGELFVVGAEMNPDLNDLIKAMVASVYVTPADRALWGLPPVPAGPAATSARDRLGSRRLHGKPPDHVPATGLGRYL